MRKCVLCACLFVIDICWRISHADLLPRFFHQNPLGAHMRRASDELQKRRSSMGAPRGLRSDGTLDPYHAAILFRDSRGVSSLSMRYIIDYKLAVIYNC